MKIIDSRKKNPKKSEKFSFSDSSLHTCWMEMFAKLITKMSSRNAPSFNLRWMYLLSPPIE